MKSMEIPLDRLVANPWNPNVLSKQKAKSLAKQIERVGFRQDVIVREVANGNFQIIDGEHRVEALRKIGKETASCLVVDDDDTEAKVQTLAMNVLRGEPDILKTAKLIVDLSETFSEKELADRIGLSDVEIADYRALGALDTGDLKTPPDPARPPKASLLYVFEFESESEHELVVKSINELRNEEKLSKEKALVRIVEFYLGKHTTPGKPK